MSNPTKILWAVCLSIFLSSGVADDEVLDSAAAVREMIQSMDIPRAEKDRFLSQVQGIERIQESAIRIDIDSLLRKFEGALDAWMANQRLWNEWSQMADPLIEAMKRAMAEKDSSEAGRLIPMAQELQRNHPPGSLPFTRRAKELDDMLVREFTAAKRDGVDVRRQIARYDTAVENAERMLGNPLAEYYREIQ